MSTTREREQAIIAGFDSVEEMLRAEIADLKKSVHDEHFAYKIACNEILQHRAEIADLKAKLIREERAVHIATGSTVKLQGSEKASDWVACFPRIYRLETRCVSAWAIDAAIGKEKA